MIAGLLLAAGSGRRFGGQKLLAVLDGRPLVRHAADALLAGGADALTAVVAPDDAALIAELRAAGATIVLNEDARTGMASSIRRGVRSLPPEADAVVIGLGDQPRVPSGLVHEVIAAWRTLGTPIVAVAYTRDNARVIAPPTLFARPLFDELEQLTGDSGARSVIEHDLSRVTFVTVAGAPPVDVDEPGDLSALRAGARGQGSA